MKPPKNAAAPGVETEGEAEISGQRIKSDSTNGRKYPAPDFVPDYAAGISCPLACSPGCPWTCPRVVGS